MKKLLMIPGPTPVDRTIQEQMGRETVAFGDPDFVDDFKKVIEDLKEMVNCSGEVFVVSGSGSLAMEMAAANSAKKGDDVLIISQGFFGDRFADIFRKKKCVVDVLSSPWGEVVPLEKIREQLEKKPYKVVAVTHVDTSTGSMAPIEAIGQILKDYVDTIYIVDGVCATAGIKEDMEGMGINILLTGSQKAFGVAPGLAIVWADEKALKRRQQMGEISEYYGDFDLWLPIMKDPSKYFATPAINLIWAMKEAIRIIKEEGLQQRYDRHKKMAKAMQESLEEMGFTILAKPECRAYTLSNVLYPAGTDDQKFRKTLAEEGVQVAGGLGEYAGKMFRLGHMGNIDLHDLVAVIAAIERTMYKCGMVVEFGKGVATLQKLMN